MSEVQWGSLFYGGYSYVVQRQVLKMAKFEKIFWAVKSTNTYQNKVKMSQNIIL